MLQLSTAKEQCTTILLLMPLWLKLMQGALNQKDSEFKEALSQQDAEFLTQLSQNVQQHQLEVAVLQDQLSQKSCHLVAHQHEIERLQQQLEEAANKARRAEASSAVIRYVIGWTRLHKWTGAAYTLTNSLCELASSGLLLSHNTEV